MMISPLQSNVKSPKRLVEEAEHSGELHLKNCKIKNLTAHVTNAGLSDVTLVDCSSNNLNEVPLELCEWYCIDTLNLSNNLIKSIPDFLTALCLLEVLDLSNNLITHLPFSICELKVLTTLYLQNNKIVSLPNIIGQLTNCQFLDISGNELTTLPPEIGNMSSLKHLDVSRNTLSALPEELSQLEIVYLNASCNKIATLPFSYRNMKSLKYAIFDYNPLTSPPLLILRKGRVHMFKLMHTESLKSQRHQEVIEPLLARKHDRALSKNDYSLTEVLENMYEENVNKHNLSLVNSKMISDNNFSTLGFDAETAQEKKQVHEKELDGIGDVTEVLTENVNETVLDGVEASILESLDNDLEKQSSPVKIKQDSPVKVEQNSPVKDKLNSPLKVKQDASGNSRLESPTKIQQESPGKAETVSPTKFTAQSPNSSTNVSPVHFQQESSVKSNKESPIIRNKDSPNKSNNTSPNKISVNSKKNSPAIAPTSTKRLPYENSYDLKLKPKPISFPGYTPAPPIKQKPKKRVASHLYEDSSDKPHYLEIIKPRSANLHRKKPADPESDISFTMRRKTEKIYEELELLEELRSNIESTLKMPLPQDLLPALTDGVMLCHLANHVKSRSIPTIHVPSPAVPKLSLAKCRRNVDNFLEACVKLGVHKSKLCSTDDIMQGKGLSRIVLTVTDLLKAENQNSTKSVPSYSTPMVRIAPSSLVPQKTHLYNN